MAPPGRKRHAPVHNEDEDAEDSTPRPATQRNRRPSPEASTQRRRRPSPESSTQRRRPSPADSAHGDSFTQADPSTTTTDQALMVKHVVRLALACEYSRTPIRRADISAKCLGPQSGRNFKPIFEEAQLTLRRVFGMELAELPLREKNSVQQRRAAAQKAGSQAAGKGGAAGSGVWMLRSVLPQRFHTTEILPPPKCPTGDAEAAYVGLYSLVVAVVSLSGGAVQEGKLERHLKRLNAEQSTPVGKTQEVLGRMCKEGYLHKVKEGSGADELVEYHVGPRGKVEVGMEGVAGLVRKVYGEGGEGIGEDELARRIERSLNVWTGSVRPAGGDDGEGVSGR